MLNDRGVYIITIERKIGHQCKDGIHAFRPYAALKLTPYRLCLVWLNSFSNELSPKRYWRGRRFRQMGEEGDYTPNATLSSTRMTPALRQAATRVVLVFHYL